MTFMLVFFKLNFSHLNRIYLSHLKKNFNWHLEIFNIKLFKSLFYALRPNNFRSISFILRLILNNWVLVFTTASIQWAIIFNFFMIANDHYFLISKNLAYIF